MSKKRRRTWLSLLGLGIVAVAVVFVVTRPSSRNPSDSATGGVDPYGGRARIDYSPGAEIRLFIPRRDSIMVAADEAALGELMDAISAKSVDVQKLTESGKIFTVPNDTRARIIETRFPKIKVRIIEGDRIMSEGWVPETWVK